MLCMCSYVCLRVCVRLACHRYLMILFYKTLSLSASLAESLLKLCTGLKPVCVSACVCVCTFVFLCMVEGLSKDCLIENTCHERVTADAREADLFFVLP